ncbi:MAG: hypothetical protein IT350_14130 [Deltaproteobacteria bacterium]|nr:hypothetical protein [Deltaproteobacteria bacterium]
MPRVVIPMVAVLAAACVAVVLACRPSSSASDSASSDPGAPCAAYELPVQLGVVEDGRLTEISGIAVSAKNPGVIWAHNDSGDGPFVYAMTREGRELGRVKLAGGWAMDWEDMSMGRCAVNGADDWCLDLADIGDNDRRRHDLVVYRIVEPTVDPAAPFGEIPATVERMLFAYPDGPRDAEAIARHPDGTLYILSKEPDGITNIYRFGPDATRTKTTLEKLGVLKTARGRGERVTAADIHPSGRRLLVRTYDSMWEYPVEPDRFFESLLAARRSNVPFAKVDQGEAVAYDPVHGGIVQIGEGPRQPIWFTACRK